MTIAGEPAAIQTDSLGNALGGLRLPEVEVPTARYSFNGKPTDFSGRKEPFSPEKLKALYPTHEAYVDKVRAAALAARKAGVLPQYRVDQYIEVAQAAAIPPR
jgi:hypothetical protein